MIFLAIWCQQILVNFQRLQIKLQIISTKLHSKLCYYVYKKGNFREISQKNRGLEMFVL